MIKTEEIINKIKSSGHWMINFQPLDIIPCRIKELPDCKNIIEKNSVMLRGWDYPHFPQKLDEDSNLSIGNNYYEGWTNWQGFIELWRMYQSGQFIHYKALREDWFIEDIWATPSYKAIKPKTVISIIGIIFHISEVFEFLSRLCKDGLYDNGVYVKISLNNTEGRALTLFNDFDLEEKFNLIVSRPDSKKAQRESIIFEENYPKEKIILGSRQIAIDTIIFFLHRFMWDKPPKEIIAKQQENLYKHKQIND